MYFDGSLNLEGAGAGVLFISPQGEQLKYVLQIHYKASNNGAEYEALIHGLRIVVSLGIKRLLTYGDSKVVIEQVNKEWDCVKDTMDAYCHMVRSRQPTGVLMWFSYSARGNLRLRTRRLRMSTQNTESKTSLYWFGTPESKTLRPVVGVDCLRIT
jgi:YD repeat-containing protein